MKRLWAVILLFYSAASFGQGTDCNDAITIPLDSVCHPYTISTSTGTAVECAYAGTGRTTYFKFTTNALGSCVLINLSTSGSQKAEATLWTNCHGGGSVANEAPLSHICFDDGQGFWAPCLTDANWQPNTTYWLRIWTPGTGTLTLCAKNYTPPNNYCAGATPISSTPIFDQNSCNKGSTEVLPDALCATSLENTAFYTYTIDVTGASIVTISNITCDNSNFGVNAGFQIGFFTGNCGALAWQSCYSDSAGTVNATTGSFPAGTKVTVAIDGMIGSNCSYTISAFNAIPLPANLRYFSGWKKQNANSLRWLTLAETNSPHFEIEKSLDGINFFQIGNINGHNINNTETPYSFDDPELFSTQYYRLKIVATNGKFVYTNIVKIKRDEIVDEAVTFQNYVPDKLILRVSSPNDKKANINIVDAMGRQMKTQKANFSKGENICTLDVQTLSRGLYYLVITDENSQKQWSFVKL